MTIFTLKRPSPQRVAFQNPKTIRNKVVSSKLEEFIYKEAGTNICSHSNCDVCKMLESGDPLKVRLLRKNTAVIFHLIVTVVP